MSASESTPTLLVFLKNPIPGQVKTRLAATVGPQRAAALYREWIGIVLDRLQPLRSQIRVVGYFTGGPPEAFGVWNSLADEWWPQPEGDLGHRLEAGFSSGHARGGPVIAIGTDCLDLDPPLLQLTIHHLATTDTVFGPSLDGGYYLVGTARKIEGFFLDVPWSTPSTLLTHLSRCLNNRWTFALLPSRRDIDTEEDWLAYQALRPRHPDLARG